MTEESATSRGEKEAAVVEAARNFVEKRKAWEETARMTERPPDLSRIKRDARRAERELIARVEELED